jgi:tripartite-type tricarboxylate transporter receptor subunit TctC
LNYSSGGTGTTSHLAPALFLVRAGITMTHIPYKGGAQAVADLVGGQVQMQMGNASEQIQYSKTGKIRMLAATSEKRTPQLPDLPTIAETYPGFRAITWNGYLAPAGTPKALIDRLAQVIIKVVREPATAARLNNMGVDPLGNTPEEFADYVRRDDAVWRDAVKAAGVQLE